MSSILSTFVLILLTIGSVLAQDCTNPTNSEDVVYCLGKELRDSDTSINQAYKKLMSFMPENERTKLRNDQRAWLKERDEVCMCESKEKDREKWFQEILKDYRKTVCVTRYTRQRTAELERIMRDYSSNLEKEKQKINDPQHSDLYKHDISEYRFYSKSKTIGLWYFEALVNVGKIAGTSPTALFIGCIDERIELAYGDLSQIRSLDQSQPIKRLGFALDLEAGKLYIRENGNWIKGEPGTSGGMDLKLGHPYKAGIETTVLIKPLKEKGYLQFNLGERAFDYSIPNGYRPFTE